MPIKFSGRFFLIFIFASQSLFAQNLYTSAAQLKAQIETAKNDSARSYYYLLLSNTYIELNQLDSCRLAAQAAFSIAQQAQLPLLMAWANHLEGNYHFYQGSFYKGIAIQTLVAQQAMKLNAPLLEACASKMIGWMYLEMGRVKEAEALFKKSLPVFKKYVSDDFQMNVGIAYYGMATAYFYLQEYPLAKLYYDSAINARPSMDEREMALALADRAALFRDELHDVVGARNDVARAIQLIDPFPFQHDVLAYAKAELALIEAADGRMRQADQIANEALAVYERTPFIRRYVSVYQTLSRTFILTENYKKTYEVGLQIQTLKDSIFEWRKVYSIEDVQVKYETEKAKNAIQVLEKEKVEQKLASLQSQSIFIVVIVAIVTMIIGLSIYYRKREKYLKRIKSLEAAQLVHQEQERIKQELHDNLGGQLSSISMGLNRLAKNNADGAIQNIQAVTDKAIAELRDSLWVMDKDAISIAEIEQRINGLFWQYRKVELPITFLVKVEETLLTQQLKASQAGNLFRIIQEATHNCVKHSQCTQFEVAIDRNGQYLKITICDDGVGFDRQAKHSIEQYGLKNIKIRAEQIHATVSVESALGKGVKIVLLLPMVRN
jgi:signal transduction histidine kinase